MQLSWLYPSKPTRRLSCYDCFYRSRSFQLIQIYSKYPGCQIYSRYPGCQIYTSYSKYSRYTESCSINTIPHLGTPCENIAWRSVISQKNSHFPRLYSLLFRFLILLVFLNEEECTQKSLTMDKSTSKSNANGCRDSNSLICIYFCRKLLSEGFISSESLLPENNIEK